MVTGMTGGYSWHSRHCAFYNTDYQQLKAKLPYFMFDINSVHGQNDQNNLNEKPSVQPPQAS